MSFKRNALRDARKEIRKLKRELGIAYPNLGASMERMSKNALVDLINLIRFLRKAP